MMRSFAVSSTIVFACLGVARGQDSERPRRAPDQSTLSVEGIMRERLLGQDGSRVLPGEAATPRPDAGTQRGAPPPAKPKAVSPTRPACATPPPLGDPDDGLDHDESDRTSLAHRLLLDRLDEARGLLEKHGIARRDESCHDGLEAARAETLGTFAVPVVPSSDPGVALAARALGAAAPGPKVPKVLARHFSRTGGRKIDMIVIHKVEGSARSAVSWFRDPRCRASAHYVVDAKSVVQTVEDRNVAWHSGNGSVNRRSIGIENAGFTAKNDTSDAHYRRLARLVASLCREYRIPVDRKHIIGHNEVPDPAHRGKFGGRGQHDDPGRHWDWARFMSYVRAAQ